ncbi:MAG: FHA domain-containing protein [Vicinamibacteria bacterium]|nr:FHA domain-containing protein [Vicinamibacteria bacterium]
MSERPDSPRLVWLRPDGQPQEFVLQGDGPLHVGRDNVELLVDEPLVSRCHARLERREDGWHVLDLDSTNKTRVNGAIVTEAPLRDGDEIRFGRAVCRYRDATATPEAPPALPEPEVAGGPAVPAEPPAEGAPESSI